MKHDSEYHECHNKLRLREFSKLKYGDPRGFLARLRKFQEENSLALGNSPCEVRNLRTNLLKPERERRDAALFCVGLSELMNCEVRFATVEDQDYDFVASSQEADAGSLPKFCPVQLKEVVPSHLNANASIERVLKMLTKYVDSQDLVVAIKFNKAAHFNPVTLEVPAELQLRGIWVYGSIAADQSEWAIWGNFIDRKPVTAGLRYGYPSS
ncbi:hypothetical protein FGU71_05000 [Erythrobacter insulae]|uniref:Uncharacterized protein n=1 Tax=Erythrobacter insulae TaxID=2584124 RepID=A0A547PAU1_9SPHN|nr:hypothetical protein [Erythrobacter insulae]TRD11268.1 hypothetical protein FGU71_05000 [Erythrobacter insulae]